MDIVTGEGIRLLVEKKRNNEELPEGWKSQVRCYFHRKMEILKRVRKVPDMDWFRNFVKRYDEAVRELGMDLKEFENARFLFENFLKSHQKTFEMLIKDLEES